MEPKQAVLESKMDYAKMGINGKLELVCAHKYGYFKQVIVIVPGDSYKQILS
jgi:hypothetical protein